MLASIQYDIAAGLIASGVGLIIATLIISVIESLVMFLLKWDRFGRSLWASLLMNVISTIFGICGVYSMIFDPLAFFTDMLSWLAISFAFLLSVLIEGGILMLIKRHATGLNWKVSLIANIASYLLIILPMAWLMTR